MFYYVHNEKSKRMKDRLKLLAKPFDVTINMAGLAASDVIENLEHSDIDKASTVEVRFTPVLFLLP